MLSPRARFKAGGYSLRLVVAHWPSAVLPIAAVRGRSGQRRCLCKNVGRLSMFRVRNLVGFGDFAPKSPCAKSTNSNPGSCLKIWMIGRRQMEGLVSSAGSPGCSSTPIPSDLARQIRRSMEKTSSSLPTATCPCSRSDRDGSPQSHSKDLRGRG